MKPTPESTEVGTVSIAKVGTSLQISRTAAIVGEMGLSQRDLASHCGKQNTELGRPLACSRSFVLRS